MGSGKTESLWQAIAAGSEPSLPTSPCVSLPDSSPSVRFFQLRGGCPDTEFCQQWISNRVVIFLNQQDTATRLLSSLAVRRAPKRRFVVAPTRT